jgi:hypothetical protein
MVIIVPRALLIRNTQPQALRHDTTEALHDLGIVLCQPDELGPGQLQELAVAQRVD